ncbi:MAG: hypothetical protein QM790_18170 [Nibricoccus sp.]
MALPLSLPFIGSRKPVLAKPQRKPVSASQTIELLPIASVEAAPSRDSTPEAATDQKRIESLVANGDFATAAQLAVAAPLDQRRDFTIVVYHEWGRRAPEQAIASAIHIQDAYARDFAVHSVLSGWAHTEPETMAEAALVFPEGEEQKAALTKALRAWMVKDPEVAGEWIMSHPKAIAVADDMFRRDRRD